MIVAIDQLVGVDQLAGRLEVVTQLAAPFDTAVGAASRLVPKILGFLAILVVGWITATVLRKLTVRLLHKVGLAAALERGGLIRAGEGSHDPTALLARGVYYAVFLVALTLAFGVFGDNPVSGLLAGVLAFLPKAAIAIVIVLVTAAIARAVRDLINGILGGLSYARLMANLAGTFILGLGIIAALNQIGVATTVTTPVLITVLATIGGILVVGVGGGLIRPMQRRWERWLDVAEREGRNIGHTVHYNTEPPATEPVVAEPPGSGPRVSEPSGAAPRPPIFAPEPFTPERSETERVAGEPFDSEPYAHEPYTPEPFKTEQYSPEPQSPEPARSAQTDDQPTQVFAAVEPEDYKTGR